MFLTIERKVAFIEKKGISFKVDDQTRAGEYGEDYNGNIKLEQFLNLQTGEWLE